MSIIYTVILHDSYPFSWPLDICNKGGVQEEIRLYAIQLRGKDNFTQLIIYSICTIFGEMIEIILYLNNIVVIMQS